MSSELQKSACDISASEYESFSDFLRASCGISLGPNKQYLVATRMRRVLLEQELRSIAELVAKLANPGERSLRQKVIDAMTTNETFWFRDGYPFDYLARSLLPGLLQGGAKTVRVWSAACSSGQEPYSISMVVEEYLRSRGALSVEVEILATDLCSTVLEAAKQGLYDRLSLARGLSAERTQQFFQRRDDDFWALKDNIKRRVRFRPVNLQDSYLMLGRFDIIFCRNVLIYFSADTKQQVLAKLHSVLNPGGILFLGSSESITGASHLFDVVNCNPGVAYRAK